MTIPCYQKELISPIPAARLLVALGYQYLSPAQALERRGGRERNVILTGVLKPWLEDHNRIPLPGRDVRFNPSAISEALRRISDVPLNNGLTRANEQIYDLLTLGISLLHTHEGDTRHYSFLYQRRPTRKRPSRARNPFHPGRKRR